MRPAGYLPLKLFKLDCSRGAPMGRPYFHRTGLTLPQFQLERVPLMDGAYDCGGAYWGAPDDLWCADFTTPLTGTQIVHYYVRAKDREAAMAEVRKTYPDAEFLPETGSIIKQTIEYLRNYCDTLSDSDLDGELKEDTEREIDLLEDELIRIRSE
jgi:hypothetical protein